MITAKAKQLKAVRTLRGKGKGQRRRKQMVDRTKPIAHPNLEGAHRLCENGEPVVRLSVDKDGIGLLVLNRPKVRNACNDTLYLAVADGLCRFAADEKCLAVIITGVGSFFCSGADIGSFDGKYKLGEGQAFDPVGVFMRTVMKFPKPLIAAVNGPAIGIGTTLLAHCDLVYATEGAYFWTPFARIAVVPEFSSSYLFPKLFGQQVANEMLIFSKKLDVKRAESLGFVSKVFPDSESFLETVKQQVRESLDYPLIDKSLPMFKAMIKSMDGDKVEKAFWDEMEKLDERANQGDIMEAVMELSSKMQKEKAKTPSASARL